MASSQITFDVVALLITVLLLIAYRGKSRGNMAVYGLSYGIVVVTLFSAVFHIVLFFLMREGAFVGYTILNLVYVLYSINLYMLEISMSIYILSYAGVKYMEDRKWALLATIPGLIAMVMYAISPFTHYMFSFNEDYQILFGKYHPIIYFIMLYYCVIWFVILKSYADTMDDEQKRFIVLIAILNYSLEVAVFLLQNTSLISFGVACACMIMLYSMKSPDEIYDNTTSIYKKYMIRDLTFDFDRKKGFTCLFVNIQNVTALEETYGEIPVNVLLRQVVDYFKRLHSSAVVYRLKEDYFVVKFKASDEKTLSKVKDRLSDRLAADWHSGDINTKLMASVVVVCVPEDVKDENEFRSLSRLIANSKLAPGAMITVDEFGKQDKEVEILAAVKKATKNKTFKVYYQPIYDTKKKKIVAAEALIRLIDDELGFISPEIFIPLAEREGYILEIGRFVFEEVCRFYSESKLKNRGIDYIEVNLSAIQCMHSELANEFIEIMQEHGLTFDQINFEITETSAMDSNIAVTQNMNCFVDNGVDLSLDDYGTGYSNLSYLYHLPFSFVKIDKSILWSAEKNEKASITLENIFKMAKNLSMKIVVEGVETEEHIKKLLNLECDYFQGYYFSKPVPGKDFVDYVNGFVLPEVCK